MGQTVRALRARGHNTMSLTVFHSNTATRDFCRKLGGTEGGVFPVAIFGKQVSCFTVKWSDLSALR